MKIKNHDIIGITLASLIAGGWTANLLYLLLYFNFRAPQHYFLIWLQSFLSIGLFITAHDAMHGTLAPSFPSLNNFFGRLSLLLYAGFSFSKLKEAHVLHHQFPATLRDPDFAAHGNERFTPWLKNFIFHYYGWTEFFKMSAIVAMLLLFNGSMPKLLVAFAFPSIFSAIQLFYFGTYLTHRTPRGGHTHPHRATSNHFSTLVSLLTCYHFGYHQEHHDHPSVPWWKLPEIYQSKNRA